MKQILTDSDGNIFESFEKISEDDADKLSELTHCLAVVKVNGDYLFGWNKWRNRYEIFGGCIENGETARSCIIRECYEELGIDGDFEYLGTMKFLMMPDYFSDKERTEYGCLYGITINGKTLCELSQQIKDHDEILNIALYSEIKGKEPIAEIDEALIGFYK